MGKDEPLTVEAVAWCDEAADVLSAAVSFCPVAELAVQVEAGAVLFKVSRGAALVGYYVLRVDRLAGGNEGVLVAGAGRDGGDLVAALLPHIERQFIGCASIRIHTARPGLAKKLATMAGYSAGEIVMRKRLK